MRWETVRFLILFPYETNCIGNIIFYIIIMVIIILSALISISYGSLISFPYCNYVMESLYENGLSTEVRCYNASGVYPSCYTESNSPTYCIIDGPAMPDLQIGYLGPCSGMTLCVDCLNNNMCSNYSSLTPMNKTGAYLAGGYFGCSQVASYTDKDNNIASQCIDFPSCTLYDLDDDLQVCTPPFCLILPCTN